jgi:hypothetical protein
MPSDCSAATICQHSGMFRANLGIFRANLGLPARLSDAAAETSGSFCCVFVPKVRAICQILPLILTLTTTTTTPSPCPR